MSVTPSSFGTPGAPVDAPDYIAPNSPASGAHGVAEEHDKDAAEILATEDRLLALEQALLATPWSSTVTYANHQLVLGSNSQCYQSQQANNVGHDPTTSGTAWWVGFGGTYLVQQ
jgi:hypothetical protein